MHPRASLYIFSLIILTKLPCCVSKQPVNIGDYEDLHAFPVKTPDSVHDYEDDDTFARLRLQGEHYHQGTVQSSSPVGAV